jgi:hypothetical protein
MNVRVTAAPAGLIRVQIDEQVRYLNPFPFSAAPSSSRAVDRDSIIPVALPDDPVLRTDDCQIFVLELATRLDIVIIKTLPRLRFAAAA